ncbi:MAG: hypothetical protein Aurels2KO_48140 [Aureliella sp.]
MPMEFLVKAIPADFVVSECLAIPIGCTNGDHYLKLRKCGYRTLDAANLVADEFGIERDQVGYAGLKDEDAITEQYITLPHALTSTELNRFNQAHSSGESFIFLDDCRCKGDRLSIGRLDGNSFRLVVRGLSSEIAEELKRVPRSFRLQVLNYYDSQRFGVPNGQKQNHRIGRALLEGDMQLAFETLKDAATPDSEKAFQFRGSPAEFFSDMDPRIRAFYCCAHASFEWNQQLEKEVSVLATTNTAVLKNEGIEFTIPRNNTDASALMLRKPSIEYETYRANGQSIEQKISERPTVYSVRFRQIQIAPDELNIGSWKCSLNLFLPSGAYATNAVRQFLFAVQSRIVQKR